MQAWTTVRSVASSLFLRDLPALGEIESMSVEQRVDVLCIFHMCGPAIPPLPLLSMGHLAVSALCSLTHRFNGAEVFKLFGGSDAKAGKLLPHGGTREVYCKLCNCYLIVLWAARETKPDICWACMRVEAEPGRRELLHALPEIDLAYIREVTTRHETYTEIDYFQMSVLCALTDGPSVSSVKSLAAFSEEVPIVNLAREAKCVGTKLKLGAKYQMLSLPIKGRQAQSVIVNMFDQLKGPFELLAPWVSPSHCCGAGLFLSPASGHMVYTAPHVDSNGICTVLLRVESEVDAPEPRALWCFLPIGVYAPESEHKNVLTAVLGSSELVGSLGVQPEGGELPTAANEGSWGDAWKAMRKLLCIPGVVVIEQHPGDVLCQGAGWVHCVVTEGICIKVACDRLQWRDVPVMRQMRKAYAGKRMGKYYTSEGGAGSQAGAVKLAAAACRL